MIRIIPATPLVAALLFWGMSLGMSIASEEELVDDPDFGKPITSEPVTTRSQDANLERFLTDPVSVYGRQVRYEVFRNDKLVGTHSVTFEKNDNALKVVVASNLVVRYLGIPVYKYTYSAIERWLDNQLVSVESTIRDNRKKPRKISAVLTDRLLEITDRGVVKTAPKINFPSNHWHPGVLNENRVYHTLHGKVHTVKIKDLGSEKVQLSLGGETNAIGVLQARKYRYQGGFSALVWYDANQRWIRLVFNADDGSRIDYRCVNCL